MKKISAFTMIELIFVIIIVGILSAMAIPRIDRDNVIEAANQMVSDIRYTQHLALMDHKFDRLDKDWFKERWTYEVTKSKKNVSTTIFSDKSHTGNPDASEIAKDPQNPDRLLTGGSNGGLSFGSLKTSENMLLSKKFSISNVVFSGGCNGSKKISFDEFGRPYSALQNATNPGDKVLKEECKITIADDAGKEAVISLLPETGYVKIISYPTSD